MTTPDERLRCLIWGSELLGEIEQNELLPSEQRSSAAGLQSLYPSPDELRQLVRNRAKAMSLEHAASIEAARDLFESVRCGGAEDPALRRFVEFTLRHFPTKGLATTWVRGFFLSVDDWLAEANSR